MTYSCAFHAEGRHEADRGQDWLCILGLPRAPDCRRVEVRRIVLGEDFSLRHVGSVQTGAWSFFSTNKRLDTGDRRGFRRKGVVKRLERRLARRRLSV